MRQTGAKKMRRRKFGAKKMRRRKLRQRRRKGWRRKGRIKVCRRWKRMEEVEQDTADEEV